MSKIINAEVPLRFEASFAAVVKEFAYSMNHHTLKLTDHKDREITMVEHGVLKYTCARTDGCGWVMFTSENIGETACNRCGMHMEQEWTTPQVALIPQAKSEFVMPRRHVVDPQIIIEEDTTAVTDKGEIHGEADR